ncbi:MAG: hypothetical protein DMG38_00685 [Acidobacteria bacterium]|nr:MAG: hypothetical protein DMG38_00685 [Acidobacteriota bacterium]
MLNTLDELFPLIARLEAPGPLIVRFLLIKSSPLVRVMVPVTPKLIVSPDDALAIESRSEPGPLSARLVTVIVAAKAGRALKTAAAKSEAKIPINSLCALGFTSHLYIAACAADLKSPRPFLVYVLTAARYAVTIHALARMQFVAAVCRQSKEPFATTYWALFGLTFPISGKRIQPGSTSTKCERPPAQELGLGRAQRCLLRSSV